MSFGLSIQTRQVLLRGAALALIGALAAGCSSTSQRFDQLFAGTKANAAPVDQTATGSVAQAGAPVPAAPVGAGQPVYQAPQPTPAGQPLYAGQPMANSQVARSTLAPPTGAAPMQAAPVQTAAIAQPAMPAVPAAAGGAYTVVSGDTLLGIARRTGSSAAAIRSANNLNSDTVRLGQTLTIPGASAATVAAATPAAASAPTQVAAVPTVDPVTTSATPAPQQPATPAATTQPQQTAYAPAAAQSSVESAVREGVAEAPNSTGVGKMRWPVRGRVISNFGSGGDGIDISVPQGTPVMAAENGVVIYAGDGLKEFGNTVLVRHDDGLVTVYGHASELKVARGEKVSRGQQIATSGMSGSADTPKLRFEVRKDSSPVNPAGYLE